MKTLLVANYEPLINTLLVLHDNSCCELPPSGKLATNHQVNNAALSFTHTPIQVKEEHVMKVALSIVPLSNNSSYPT